MAVGTSGIAVQTSDLVPPGKGVAGRVAGSSGASAGVSVDVSDLSAPGPSSAARVASAAGSSAGVDVLSRDLFPRGRSISAWIDELGGVWVPSVSLSGRQVLFVLGSRTHIPAGTWYLGANGLKADEKEAAWTVPAGTYMELLVSSNKDPVGSCVVTLRKGTGATPEDGMADSAQAITLGSGERKDKSENQISFSDENWASLKIVTTGTPSEDFFLSITQRFDFAE